MNEYYQKYYKEVPLEVRQIISSDAQMEILDEMAERYGLNLAMFVIRVMIRDIELNSIKSVLVDEFGLDEERAKELEGELREKIFAPIMGYLERGEARAGGGADVETGEVKAGEEAADVEQPVSIIEPSQMDVDNVALAGQLDEDMGQGLAQDFALDVEVGGSVSDELGSAFRGFTKSSIYINAQEFANGLMDRKLDEIKEEFYKAVNAREVFKVIGSLMMLARRGVLRHAFENDERYIEFWKKQLNRQGLQHGEEDFGGTEKPGGREDDFLKDPAREKYLVSFFRFILEKKCSLPERESAIVGVVLGALSREAGELEYQDLAYGDEEAKGFRWVK